MFIASCIRPIKVKFRMPLPNITIKKFKVQRTALIVMNKILHNIKLSFQTVLTDTHIWPMVLVTSSAQIY